MPIMLYTNAIWKGINFNNIAAITGNSAFQFISKHMVNMKFLSSIFAGSNTKHASFPAL